MTSLGLGRSPSRRAFSRFWSNRTGRVSFLLFSCLFLLSLLAEVLSNDRPIIVSYQGHLYVPLFIDYPETTFGGDFETSTDYLDPMIRTKLSEGANWVIFPPNLYSFDTLNYSLSVATPAPPSSENWLGTDDRGRDVVAILLYGFRLSVLFGFALTAIGICLGAFLGAIQGYFVGKTDLFIQRLVEVWSAVPELYLLLVIASVFEPSLFILFVFFSLFSWMGFSDYVRAEFLRNRRLDYVVAAEALGLRHDQIILRHVLPNSLTSSITFLPFRMSGAILGLTTLDFLGFGVSASAPSLGELLAQGKDNIDAWWITLPTMGILALTFLLLIFLGEALRDALDTRGAP